MKVIFFRHGITYCRCLRWYDRWWELGTLVWWGPGDHILFLLDFFFIKVNREKQKQDSFCLMLTGSVCGWAVSWHFLLTFYKTDKPIRIPTSHSIWASLKLSFFLFFTSLLCYFLILQVSASEFPHMNNYQVSSCCDVWLFGTALNTFCLQTWWNNASYTLDYYKHMPVHFKSTLFFPKASLITHFSDQFSLCTWKFSRPWLEETESCILLALPGPRLLFTSHMHCYNPVWWCRSDVSWPFKGKSPHTT